MKLILIKHSRKYTAGSHSELNITIKHFPKSSVGTVKFKDYLGDCQLRLLSLYEFAITLTLKQLFTRKDYLFKAVLANNQSVNWIQGKLMWGGCLINIYSLQTGLEWTPSFILPSSVVLLCHLLGIAKSKARGIYCSLIAVDLT